MVWEIFARDVLRGIRRLRSGLGAIEAIRQHAKSDTLAGYTKVRPGKIRTLGLVSLGKEGSCAALNDRRSREAEALDQG